MCDRKSKLGLECRTLASLDQIPRKNSVHFPVLLLQRCGHISKAKMHCWNNELEVEEECCKAPFYVMN